MNTYSEQPDGPGALLWAVIIMATIIGMLLFMIYGCEPLEPSIPIEDKLKSVEDTSVYFIVTFPDFADTIITITL